jgi:hypothetical protein
MNHGHISKIKDHTEELEKIYKQRRQWLYASSIVYTGVILLIFGWDYVDSLHNDKIWWVVISISLLISVNWWYWTMKSLATLVRSIYDEYEILNEVTDNIEELREVIVTYRLNEPTDDCGPCPYGSKHENTRNNSIRRKSSE